MADRTKIEWTDASWNPLRAHNRADWRAGHYCEMVSPGCAHCYASAFQPRFGLPMYSGPSQRPQRLNEVQPFLDEKELVRPLRWRKPRRVFVCSMTDLFGDWHNNDWLNRCFAVMALAAGHTFQVLTKRHERMRDYMSDARRGWYVSQWMAGNAMIPAEWHGTRPPWPPPNVWLGVSVEDQQRADERIPLLLATPARVRFLSVEPLLGPVDLTNIRQSIGGTSFVQGNVLVHKDSLNKGHERSAIDWTIIGGESGPHARPCEVEWVRSLVRQCAGAGTACFVKQLGAVVRTILRDENNPAYRGYMDTHYRDPKGGDPVEWPEDLRVRQFPSAVDQHN